MYKNMYINVHLHVHVMCAEVITIHVQALVCVCLSTPIRAHLHVLQECLELCLSDEVGGVRRDQLHTHTHTHTHTVSTPVCTVHNACHMYMYMYL